MTFYEPGKKWGYNTKLDYQCPPGKGFDLGGGKTSANKTLTCQWNKTWTPSEAADNMTCICECRREYYSINENVKVVLH